MAGYDLTEGRYENKTLSDDEMWSAFSNLFSSHSKNSSSYKFGFLKAIMDNLYNVDENLTLTFDQLFGTFTEVYWNLVLKHGIRQQPVSERSNGTYLEQALNLTAVKYTITPEIPFESISVTNSLSESSLTLKDISNVKVWISSSRTEEEKSLLRYGFEYAFRNHSLI